MEPCIHSHIYYYCSSLACMHGTYVYTYVWTGMRDEAILIIMTIYHTSYPHICHYCTLQSMMTRMCIYWCVMYGVRVGVDGSLVLYDTKNGNALWSTRTTDSQPSLCDQSNSDEHAYEFRVQQDGNVAIYCKLFCSDPWAAGTTPMWSTNTAALISDWKGPYTMSLLNDGNIILTNRDNFTLWDLKNSTKSIRFP